MKIPGAAVFVLGVLLVSCGHNPPAAPPVLRPGPAEETPDREPEIPEVSLLLPEDPSAETPVEPEFPLPEADPPDIHYPPEDPPADIAGPVPEPEPPALRESAAARPVPDEALPAPAPAALAARPAEVPPRSPETLPPRRETPSLPATVQPAQPLPASPPPREDPAPVLPDMPFEPLPVLPAAPSEAELNYSRTVRALVGQYIEIPFRGPGWVYLGELGSRRGVDYDSRRIDREGMVFVFRAGEAGTYNLKFNRQDFIRDYILNDYVRVVVEAPPQTTGSAWFNPQAMPERVYASPRWPLSVEAETKPSFSSREETQPREVSPEAQAEGAFPQSAGAGTTPPSAGSRPYAESPEPEVPPPPLPAPEDWLQKARDEYNGGRIASALGALDQFMARFPAGSDEAYWLYAQALEANNEATRNVRLALDYYRRLMEECPQSTRYEDARRRAVYLERFYFNIR